MTRSKILLLATTLALGAAALQPTLAMAENGRNGAAAAGIVGGLAAGAIIGGAIGNGEGDVRVEDRRRGAFYRDLEDEPVCHIERRRVENEYGEVRVRRVRVCE